MEEILRLIDLIYGAALDGEAWPRVLEAIAASLDANGAMLRMQDYTTSEVGFFRTIGYDEQYVQAYREHFINLDPYRKFFETMPVGILKTGDQVVAREKLRKGEFYNNYSVPQDKIYTVGSVLARNGKSMIQIGIQRGQRVGNYSEEDLKRLHLLAPHLRRAVQISGLLAEASSRQHTALAALDELRVGVILTDITSKPLYLNRKAEALLAEAGGQAGCDGLSLLAPSDTSRLRALVASTAQSGLASGGELRCRGSNGSLHLCVVPLPRNHLVPDLFAPTACAAIFISRPGPLKLPWQRVAAHYGLTRAEAKIATALADGTSVEETAEKLGISIHTARTQLKSLFAKTGARRQSELVAMLLQGILAIFHTGDEQA